MDSQELILQMLKDIKQEISDMKKVCSDRGSTCNNRLTCLETFKTKTEAVKDNRRDGLSWWALVIASVSGILTILINFDKVVASLK